MGYFSDLDVQLRESPSIRLQPHGEPQLPPCPICGGTEFRWGWLESGLYGIGKGPPTHEQPRYVRQKTRFGDFLGVRARVCQNCSQVELFAWEEQEQ